MPFVSLSLSQNRLRASDSVDRPPLIAIFLPSVHGGGAERAMIVFAGQLVQRGFRVDVVVARLEGALQSMIPRGVNLQDLNSRRMLEAIPKLVTYLRREQPTALFSTITHANIAAVCAAKLSRVRTRVVVRQSNAPLSEREQDLGRAICRRLIPILYRGASGIIAVSEGVKDELRRMEPRLSARMRTLPTPVLTDQVRRQGEEIPNHPWFSHKDLPIVVSAGRLEMYKGMLELVRAFARLCAHRPARLVIVGEGSQRSKLEAEARRLGISERVSLPGFQSNPFAYMNHADAFVLASHYEGLPNVLIQALAFGTPIVSTDCRSGPAEILEGGRWGTLVPVGSEEQLASAIEGALARSKDETARESAWRRFDADAATSGYLGIAGLPERMPAASPELLKTDAGQVRCD